MDISIYGAFKMQLRFNKQKINYKSISEKKKDEIKDEIDMSSGHERR